MEGEFTNEIINEMVADIKAPKAYRLTVLDVLLNSDVLIGEKNDLLSKFDALI